MYTIWLSGTSHILRGIIPGPNRTSALHIPNQRLEIRNTQCLTLRYVLGLPPKVCLQIPVIDTVRELEPYIFSIADVHQTQTEDFKALGQGEEGSYWKPLGSGYQDRQTRPTMCSQVRTSTSREGFWFGLQSGVGISLGLFSLR
jgi:hypothetical protein